MPSSNDQKLRIFFSVDVVGSTEYKTKQKSPATDWSKFYRNFFDDFQTQFAGKLSEERESSRQLPSTSIWKLLGDEILYTAVVKNSGDVVALTRAFYRSVFDYDRVNDEQSHLRVKATGWTAGFPIRNAEIHIKELSGSDFIHPDYIGQDIDIGFRLGKTTRAGRMSVSMDLAHILAGHKDLNFKFYHVGWERLKGIFDNKPYPVIWITEDDKTRTLPWEDFECALTREFLQKGTIERKTLLNLIKEVRQELSKLELIEPYYDESDMPESHRVIWEKWKLEEKLEEEFDVLNSGDDEPLGSD
ncbi:MAG TPA: hypothetical protein VF719_06395 [Abditibacteriaceae bacterium]